MNRQMEIGRLEDIEEWTNQVITGNDFMFTDLLYNRKVKLTSSIEDLAFEHLSLCARYRWYETIITQHAFRLSLISHVVKSFKEQKTEPKKEVTLEQLKSKRNGLV